MKERILLIFSIAVCLAWASQRVVVAEQFTATWCQWCPGAARALKEIYERNYDSFVVIAYHPSSSGDPFYSTEAVTRLNFYNVTGYPTSWFDGATSVVGGVHYTSTMYPTFNSRYEMRAAIASPLEITLDCDYDSIANSGSVTATVLNTSASVIDGNIHFVVVEDDIDYSWQSMSKLGFVMRDMLPDAAGETVSIPVSDTIVRARDFTINGSWDEANCRIVVFVQAPTRQIHQGAEILIIPDPKPEYYGFLPNETSGNANGVIEPGESAAIRIAAKNMGGGNYSGTPAVQCSDSFVTITGVTPNPVSIGPGDVDTVAEVSFDIDSLCPNNYTTFFTIDFGGSVDTIPFVVTTRPWLSNDIEHGDAGWTHYALYSWKDYWHITDHKSNSPSHSWYSGIESVWSYINETDAYLVSPYFVAAPDTPLCLYHQYAMESNNDYGFIDLDNGSGWWQTLGQFTGTQSSWTPVSYPLNAYGGQTMRLRFRFISDYDTQYEGWYIDDVTMPTEIGIEEFEAGGPAASALTVSPNPYSRSTTIAYQISGDCSHAFVSIYDASGRLVREFRIDDRPDGRITWSGDDEHGTEVPAGIYFIEIRADGVSHAEKLIRLR
jgi:hypothetical protein